MSGEVALIGGGRVAQALARVLSRRGRVRVWAERREVDVGASAPLVVSPSLEEACAGAAVVVFALPIRDLRAVARAYGEVATGDQVVLHTTRGVEAGFVLPHQILRAECCVRKVAALGGPLYAADLAEGRPVAAVVASRYDEPFTVAKAWVHGTPVMLHPSRDIIGVETSAAVANVAAIAVGMAEALQLGETVRGVLLTRGLTEAARLGGALGADVATFTSLAGVGELMPRPLSVHDHHVQLGLALGRGRAVEAALADVGGNLDGVVTAREGVLLGAARGLDIPLLTGVDAVLRGELSLAAALEGMLHLGLDLGAAQRAVGSR